MVKRLVEPEIGGRAKTNQTTALFRSVREESKRPEETFNHSDYSERPSTNVNGKNLHGLMQIYIYRKIHKGIQKWWIY